MNSLSFYFKACLKQHLNEFMFPGLDSRTVHSTFCFEQTSLINLKVDSCKLSLTNVNLMPHPLSFANLMESIKVGTHVYITSTFPFPNSLFLFLQRLMFTHSTLSQHLSITFNGLREYRLCLGLKFRFFTTSSLV